MATDPYRYFRIEAAELLDGLAQGLLQLDAGPNEELVRRLLRFAHTFKGASRVVKQVEIGDLAHQIEEVLSPHRETGGPVGSDEVDAALALLDRMRALVARLNEGPAVARASAGDTTQDERTVRIEVEALDGLLEGAFEAQSAARSLRRAADDVARARDEGSDALAAWDAERTPLEAQRLASEMRRLVASLEASERWISERLDRIVVELDGLRSAASELRLVPAHILTGALERLVRDDARTLAKEVDLVCTGEQTHIDAHVLAGLRTALVHVVRNCVAHGIEDPMTRQRMGKARRGRIELFIERCGDRVAIRCRDDGCGLDLDAVRRTAVARGTVSAPAAHALDERELGRLLLQGGLSTSPSVTAVAGRGVGLDAVRAAVEALKGEVRLESTPGAGTTVHILVPVSLSATAALSLEVDDVAVLIPIDNVRRALRLQHDGVVRDGSGHHIVVDDDVIPIMPLGHALNRSVNRQGATAVVVEAGGRMAALSADRVGGVRNVVVRSIPTHAAASPVISGAAFDDEGRLALVLAPPELVRLVTDVPWISDEPVAPQRLPLLIVDDSLTTRMLEQSIVESAGYDVDLAVSGEEALEKAYKRDYGLFIVDVEMPGMNGFELLERCRADARLRDIPAIMVSSRADPDDKRRGKEAGASAYIVKGEFDQAALLEAIRRLVG